MFDEKGDDEQEARGRCGLPTMRRAPSGDVLALLQKLEEQQARGGEERAGKQKAGTPG